MITAELEHQCLTAVYASMNEVLRYQKLGPRPKERTSLWRQRMKPDGTMTALPVDMAAADAGMDVLSKIPNIAVSCEERFNTAGIPGRLTGDLNSDIVIDFDPCDGSMGMALGSWTSTVILTIRSMSQKRQLLAMVGHPASGEVYCARSDAEAFSILGSLPNAEWDTRLMSVCDSDIGPTTRILVDSYPAFMRTTVSASGGKPQKKTVLSISELDRLHSNIQAKAGICAFGSNGLHHALVAYGGHAAVGAITTAIGGYWDLPVLLVLQAGGCAAAFRVEPNDGILTECDPLDVTGYDILATSNKPSNLSQIVDMIRAAKTK